MALVVKGVPTEMIIVAGPRTEMTEGVNSDTVPIIMNRARDNGRQESRCAEKQFSSDMRSYRNY